MLRRKSSRVARNISVRRLLLTAVAAAPVGIATSAHADTFSWINPGQDSWLNPANWIDSNTSTNGIPSSGDTAIIDNGGTSIIDTSDSDSAGTLLLGDSPSTSGTLSISSGFLSISNNLYVGGSNSSAGGAGTFLVSGTGVVTTPNAFIGNSNTNGSSSTAVGTTTMTGGVMTVGSVATPGALVLGNGLGTNGTFQQNGGSVAIIGVLNLGRLAGFGTYIMSNGSLSTTSDAIIGGQSSATNNGTGYFEQDNTSSVSFTGNLIVGIGSFGITTAKSVGTYQMNGGTLNVGGFIETGRANGIGTFNLNGGVINTTQNFYDGGDTSTSQGIGYFQQAAGTTFNQIVAGGSTAAFNFFVGIGNANTGTYVMNGGTLNIVKGLPAASTNDTQEIISIGNGTGHGNFIQNGGTVSLYNGIFAIARGGAATGTYDMESGTLIVSGPDTVNAAAVSNDLTIGGQTGGTFVSSGTFIEQNGADVQVNDGSVSLGVGASTTNSATGTYLMNGGSLNITRSSSALVLGNNGTGVFNQSGGTVTLASNGLINIGRIGNGTYSMTGGTLTGGNVAFATNTSANNFTEMFSLAGGWVSIGSINMGSGSNTANRTWNANSGTMFVNRAILGQNGTLNLNGATATIGSVSFFGGNLVASTSYTLGSTVDVSAPGAGNPGGGTISIPGSATTLSLGSLKYNSALALTKTGPGTAIFTGAISQATSISGSLNISQGKVQLAAPAQTVHTIGSISIANDGTSALDLTNNNLVLDYSNTGSSPLSNIRSELQSGYHSGAWTGAGIQSSSAAAAASSAHKTAIGYAESSSLFSTFPATFAGASVNSQSLLLRYVYSGDGNMDGTVNALDFNALANNYGVSGSANWVQGDFNYDGTVNSQDFAMLAANYGQSAAPSASLPDDAALPSLGALVPEPMSMTLLMGIGGAMMTRRRKMTR